MTKDTQVFDRHYRIFAGKFRRYHGESWLRRIFDIKTNVLNVRDLFYFIIGWLQSIWLLGRIKPDVILLKGGFVGVPVGYAAALRRIPFVTHDSDAIPGLANRLVSRWATWHATGAPAENYAYPQSRTKFVGVLVSNDHRQVSQSQMVAYRKELGISAQGHVLLVTGGSLGAKAINDAMAEVSPRLLEAHPNLTILHITGNGHETMYGPYHNDRLHVFPLVKGLHKYSGAADVIVTRAGANALAEFGVQGKACIVIPNPLLTGGHQVKNAQALADKDAIMLLTETEVATDEGLHLQRSIELLLDQPSRRQQLGHNLHELTPSNATEQLADLLIATAKREEK